MKSYILVGGGLLICLVLLHALVTAWRDNRRVPKADGVEVEDDQLDLDAEENAAILWTDEAVQEASWPPGDEPVADVDPEPPVLMDRSAEDAAETEEAVAAVETEDWDTDAKETEDWDTDAKAPPQNIETQEAEATPALPEAQENPGTVRRGRRIDIPGKRTEPTVPRAMRPEFHQFTPRPDRQDDRNDANGLDAIDDVIVIWLFAQPDKLLDGEALLKAFVTHGLECDSDLVFKKTDPRCGGHWFTVANGVEPGTFDISRPTALETPGVVMLLPLGQVRDPVAAFENMLDVAQELASALDGELKDEGRSDMSWQTIEHYRQRIRDFKRMLLRA